MHALLRAVVIAAGLSACVMHTAAVACFDEKKLAHTIENLPAGAVLYVWSPRMVLSAQHAASAQRQAAAQGLAFIALHDAGVPEAEIKAALSALAGSGHALHSSSAQVLAGSQGLCARSLLERDALRHFPTAFVLHSGQVHRHAIIGAMPEAAWAHSIAQRLPQRGAQASAQAAARLPVARVQP